MTTAETAGTETRTAKADAMEFLRAALVGDPVPAAELSRVAHERGLTPKAIRSGRALFANSGGHEQIRHVIARVSSRWLAKYVASVAAMSQAL